MRLFIFSIFSTIVLYLLTLIFKPTLGIIIWSSLLLIASCILFNEKFFCRVLLQMDEGFMKKYNKYAKKQKEFYHQSRTFFMILLSLLFLLIGFSTIGDDLGVDMFWHSFFFVLVMVQLAMWFFSFFLKKSDYHLDAYLGESLVIGFVLTVMGILYIMNTIGG